MQEYPGIFITFEGDDGVGKSTQAALLCERLRAQGMDAMEVREPGGTAIGECLRAIVLDPRHEDMDPKCELLIYEAARAQIVTEVILPALRSGKVVVCDRFYDSTVAYQGAGRGLDLDAVDFLNRFACDGIQPDLTLLLSMPAQDKRHNIDIRGSQDKFDAEGDDFHDRVSRAFSQLPERHPQRVVHLRIHDGIPETADEIFDLIESRFKTEFARLARGC